MGDFLNTHTSERTGIFISARGLAKMDITSNTDAFAVLYVKSLRDDQWKKAGSTDVVMDSQSPDWPIMFTIDYFFEMVQELEVRVFDRDGDKPLDDESKHELCGSAFFVLSKLMTANNQTISVPITGGKSGGQVVLRAEPVSNVRDIFHCNIKCEGLVNKDGFFGKSDPFLRFRRVYEDGTWVTVKETDFVKDNLNPTFNSIHIPISALNNGDYDRPVKVEIWDYSKNGKHEEMGECTTSLTTLLRNQEGGKKTTLDVKGKDAKGKLTYDRVEIEKRPTFSEFVMGGCEITLVVGIDFTASNGIVTDPKSLHHMHGNQGELNPYEQAIHAVGRIVDEYDTDKRYPVYGFGAKVPQANGSFGPVSHCFPLSSSSLEVNGVQGILDAYHNIAPTLMMSGPTCFTPLIDATISRARCTQDKQQYTVLLIITDGEITDMDTTIEACIRASNAPVSVLIIGVGPENFDSMNQLDSDKKALAANGEKASRDCVQFVSFRDFTGRKSSMLASEVLAELPNQLLAYMHNNNIKPNPKKA